MASAAALALAARLRIDYVRNATGRQADVSGHALLAVVSPDEPMLDFSDPLPSPDGRWIVFADGEEELIGRGDGSGTRVLAQSFQVGAWSPDSKWLA
jgi:WD40-like Beta Propeller Repeat